jgi:5'-nucleotidase / UDP-sugar diphosphatase
MKRWNQFFCFILVLFVAVTLVYGDECEIRILHVNDFHGFAAPYRPLGSDRLQGGIAYLAARAEVLRREKSSLLLSAGDMIQGNNWANLFQGASVIELMNAMRFDAMVVGNHEFEFGQEALRQRVAEAKFPLLGANVEGLNFLKPYVIRNLKGVRVAIIGVVTEETPSSTHPKNVAGLRFLSPIDAAGKYVHELRRKADVVVVLSHIGHPADRVLAERVEGIDLIVGGHSHTKVEKPVKIGKTVVVQAWEHGKALGVLDLTVKDGKITRVDGRLEEIQPKIGEEEKTILSIVKEYDGRMDGVLNQKVAEAEVDLDGESVRRRETNLGNLIADIMRSESKADVTMINGGGIRASIKKGEARVRDFYNALPFDNYIVAIRITGRQMKDALEHGVSAIEEEEGRFPQVSGLAFKFSRSGKIGTRIQEILVAGKPVDLEKEYLVATSDFLAAGGDGYKTFGEAIKASRDFSVVGGTMQGEKVVYSNAGRWLRDVVVEYAREAKKIAPGLEGRIVEIR